MIETDVKTCQECDAKMSGRSDKKFCSDQCRVAYNNKLNRDETKLMNNINNALRKNRRVLQELNPNGKTKISRDKLVEKGFDFQYFTSVYTTREGSVYRFCYDQGYLAVDQNWYLLVVKKEGY